MPDQAIDKLFAYAIRALAARAYSESVFRRKLSSRGSAEEVNQIIGRLKQAGYLDDLAYAEGYTRLYMGRWGNVKIKKSLLEKGVQSQTIDKVLAQIAPESDPVAEAVQLLERYKSRHKGDKAKAIRFLTGRGYRFGDAMAGWAEFERIESEE